MKVKSESEVAQSCLTLRDPMDCSLPGSSAHGIFQARVVEWGAIAFYANKKLKKLKKKKCPLVISNSILSIFHSGRQGAAESHFSKATQALT